MEDGGHQFDVSGLEVKLSSLVDISAGEAGVVDGQGPHRHVRLEVKLHVGPGVSEYFGVRNVPRSASPVSPYLSDRVAPGYQSVPHQPEIFTYKYQLAAVKLSLPQHQVMTPSVEGMEYQNVGCFRDAEENSQKQN